MNTSFKVRISIINLCIRGHPYIIYIHKVLKTVLAIINSYNIFYSVVLNILLSNDAAAVI